MARYIDADKLSRAKFHPLPYTHITPADIRDAESYERVWNDAIDAIKEHFCADGVPAVGECYAAAIIAKWALFEITDEELKAVPKDEGSNDGRPNQQTGGD